jgi:RIO kinase 1
MNCNLPQAPPPAVFISYTAGDRARGFFVLGQLKTNMKESKFLRAQQELEDSAQIKHMLDKRRPNPHPPKRAPAGDEIFIEAQDNSTRTFHFTYQAARFEAGWLLDSLGYFYEQHWISDVLRKVKAGKEASVYLCRSGAQVEAPLVAAKVYRPRMLRNLKNDQLYRLGRAVLDESGHRIVDLGMLKAQKKRSVYGEGIRHQSWIAHEFTALQALHAAGADVPRPYEMANNAILMEYLGDEKLPAPILNEVTLGQGEAGPLFERLLHNLDLLLAGERVHGDLSAYNVLYWQGEIALIDSPQVVSPTGNRNAYAIFERDVTRLCEYFIRQGLSLQPHKLAARLWTAHGYRIGQEADPRLMEDE